MTSLQHLGAQMLHPQPPVSEVYLLNNLNPPFLNVLLCPESGPNMSVCLACTETKSHFYFFGLYTYSDAQVHSIHLQSAWINCRSAYMEDILLIL